MLCSLLHVSAPMITCLSSKSHMHASTSKVTTRVYVTVVFSFISPYPQVCTWKHYSHYSCCVHLWMYVFFTLLLCTVHACRLCVKPVNIYIYIHMSPACMHVDLYAMWTSSLMPVYVCFGVCVCEQLRYRACRGREVISAEDDCIIWTADQRWGSK